MLTISALEKIVYQIRDDFENNKIDLQVLSTQYQKYSGIEDVELFLKRSKKIFPKLNCGVCSVYLKYKIPQLELIQGKYENNNHTFCMTADNLVVDITSDQYQGPRVYVGKLMNPWSL